MQEIWYKKEMGAKLKWNTKITLNENDTQTADKSVVGMFKIKWWHKYTFLGDQTDFLASLAKIRTNYEY